MTDSTAALAAGLVDRYRIERVVGAGGMATVYLAHDVRHDREVALKVLRPELASVIGAERFLSEIKTTAKLQHPHILPLLDSGEVTGTVFYAMPYVEGETLRRRIEREKQLPIADAVRIATEVADALDYAHRHGVIHRDIKPENILLHDRRAVVADFGIALAVSRSDAPRRMTETGMSLGTPQYMSPEQAMGERNLDARTDIFALGCVLYEMLVGEPPFTGPTAQVIVAKVMNSDPEPLTTARKTVPPNVAAATMMALNKLPADRFATAAEFAAALANPAFLTLATGTRQIPAGVAPRRRQMQWATTAVIALAGAAVGALVTWMLRRPPPPPGVVAQFEINLPDSLMGRGPFSSDAPLFPTRDGRLLWYTPAGLYARPLESFDAQLVLRNVQPLAINTIKDISPDGTQLLVASNVAEAGNPLRTGRGGGAIGPGGHVILTAVPLRGGGPRLLTDSADYAVWGDDGYVYYTFFWPAASKRGIARIRADGGQPDTLASLADSIGLPQSLTLLPGSRGLVVVVGSRAAPRLAAFDLRTRTWHPLVAGGPKVAYVEPGFLLFSSGSSIMAAPFDRDHLTLTGPARPLITADAPAVQFSVNGGVLVYHGYGSAADALPLVIRPRTGDARALPNVVPGLNYISVAVSPDGKRFVAVGASPFQGLSAGQSAQPFNLYVYELPDGPMSRLPSRDSDRFPAWLPSGKEFSFMRVSTDTPTTWSLMHRPWDGSGEASTVFSNRTGLGAASWMPDGRSVIIEYSNQPLTPPAPGRAGGRGGGGRALNTRDIGRLSLDRPDSITPLIASPSAEFNPAVSPDGRWLAYQSNESGSMEVYVRPVTGGERRQVSLTTGTNPRWAWSGRELFFLSGTAFLSAEIRTTGGLSVGAVKPVFDKLAGSSVPVPLRGDSLFIAWGEGDPTAAASRTRVVVMVNVRQALERLFP